MSNTHALFTGESYGDVLHWEITSYIHIIGSDSPGMREVGGSIPGRAKQKALEFEVLLLCLALSTKELETDWPARSLDNGLGWDITAYPWRGGSVGDHYKDWLRVASQTMVNHGRM